MSENSLTQNNVHDALVDYIYGFTTKEKFANKRFNRYLQKTEREIEILLQIFTGDKNIKFLDWAIEIIYAYYIYGDERTPEKDGQFSDMIRRYVFLPDKKIPEKMLPDPYKEYDFGSVLSIINQEFANACKLHITKQTMYHPEISEDNYNLTLPMVSEKKYVELLEIISNTINWTIVDLERIAFDMETVDELVKTLSNDYVEALEQDVREQKEQVHELEKENKQLKYNLTAEKSRYEQLEKSIESKDGDKELRREYMALQKRYDALEKKYKKICNDSEHDAVPEKELEEEKMEVDKYAKYMFIVDTDLPVAKRLMEEFPNCTLTISNDNVGFSDMVIALTKSIRHDVYHGIRTQCKNKGIPFLHCHSTAIERIRQTIAENGTTLSSEN